MKSSYIVEDHPSAQRWLTEAVEAAYPGVSVATADTVESAHRLLDRGGPDIALVDLNLPDGSGIEIIARISRDFPQAVTVVATIYDDDDHLFPALRAGAKGYILKEQRKEEISALLQGIARGSPPLSPAISQRMIEYFSGLEREKEEAVDNPLSEREQQVLALIAHGLNLHTVAEQLGVTRNTIATQVKSIYSKLNISTRAEAAIAATRLGLVTDK